MLISLIRNLWPFATIALSALSPSASASPYTGPADPTAYRKPEALICMGIAGSPKGLRLDFGATDSIGNLSDGYAMVSLDGAIGVHYPGRPLYSPERTQRVCSTWPCHMPRHTVVSVNAGPITPSQRILTNGAE
jgi:hypothetical protein